MHIFKKDNYWLHLFVKNVQNENGAHERVISGMSSIYDRGIFNYFFLQKGRRDSAKA